MGDGFRDLRGQEIDVGASGLGGELGQQRGFDRLAGGERGAQAPDAIEQPAEIAERVLEEPRIVAHVLCRRVDFMGDACGELADGFELLRLAQLTFEDLVLGDIGTQDQEPFPLSAMKQRRDGQRHEVIAPAAAREAEILHPVRLAGRGDRRDARDVGPAGAVGEAAADRVGRIEAEGGVRRGVPAGDDALAVHPDQDGGDRGQEPFGLGVRLPELLLERLAIGNVGPVREATLIVRAGREAPQKRAVGATRADAAILERGRAVVLKVLEVQAHPGAIVGVNEIEEAASDQCGRLVIEQPMPGVVDAADGAVRAAHRQQLLRAVEPVIAFGFHGPATGDVLGNRQEAG